MTPEAEELVEESSKKYEQMVMRLESAQAGVLRKLAKRTRIPQAQLIREAITDLLQKYALAEKNQ